MNTTTQENLGSAVKLLVARLQNNNFEQEIRIAAATALGNAGGDDSLQALTEFLQNHPNASVELKVAVTHAVGRLIENARKTN
jgi:HEAT repeat protein